MGNNKKEIKNKPHYLEGKVHDHSSGQLTSSFDVESGSDESYQWGILGLFEQKHDHEINNHNEVHEHKDNHRERQILYINDTRMKSTDKPVYFRIKSVTITLRANVQVDVDIAYGFSPYPNIKKPPNMPPLEEKIKSA